LHSSSTVVEGNLSEVQAIKTPSEKKERHTFAGSYFSKEESPRRLQQQTPVHKEVNTSKDRGRQHVSDAYRNNFEDQLNAVQKDVAADLFGPVTPATQCLAPRIMKRQASMHSFLSKPTLQLKQNPNSNPKPDSYIDMSKRQEEKQLLFDQLKSKFSLPKSQSICYYYRLHSQKG
jgi:hypothetical protein